MSKIFAIARKELSSYFKSPIAYIVLILTITIFNIFFFVIVDESREATLRDVFQVMEFMLVFIIPMLTMKVFAEEKSLGTMEFLLTTPTTSSAIVLGKYLGTWLLFTVLMAITGVYGLIVILFSQPDIPAMLLGYVGVWMEGSLFIAIGIWISSWTRNQIIAAITAYVVLFMLYFSMSFLKYVDGVVETFIRTAGAFTHAENLRIGIVTAGDLTYFFGGILFCLLLTRLSIESRSWR